MAVTPVSAFVREPTFGDGWMDQEEPSQCSISVR
jgi:hypothetical protein